MADDRVTETTQGTRWSSLSSRLAMLIAIVLIVSGLVTAVYSALAARNASEADAAAAMANAQRSTVLLIDQAYADTQRARTTAMDVRKAELKDVASPIVTALDQLRASAAAGEITEAQAQKAGLAVIKGVRFRKDDYFFAYNSTGTAIAHPNPKFQGKNLMSMQDPNGVFVVRDLLNIANEKGSGYLDYAWVKLNEENPSAKVGYVLKYAPWNWMIGTGVYVDDIDKEAATRLEATKQALGESFSKIDFTDNGLLFVLDKNGKVLVQPSDRDLSSLESTDWGKTLASSLVAHAPADSDQIVRTTQQAGFTGVQQPWSMDVSALPKLGWTLVSAVPQAEVDAPGNSQAVRQALLSLGVLGLGLLIGLLASRRIVRPVETMTKAATALEQDSFDPTMLDDAAARRDEVGTLARAFQRMGTEIVERERKLREQVTKLTVVIDRQKVAEEASAIAESDFFRDLEQKKNALREREDGSS